MEAVATVPGNGKHLILLIPSDHGVNDRVDLVHDAYPGAKFSKAGKE